MHPAITWPREPRINEKPVTVTDLTQACRKDTEEHNEMLDWCGGQFDPAAFSIEDINATLAQIKF